MKKAVQFQHAVKAALFMVGLFGFSFGALAQATSFDDCSSFYRIKGPTSASCQSSQFYKVENTATGQEINKFFLWTVKDPSGVTTLPTGSSLYLNFNKAGAWEIKATGNIGAGIGQCVDHTITVYVSGTSLPQPAAINGNLNQCSYNANYSYSVTPVAGAASYTWSVPAPWYIVHPANGLLTPSLTGNYTSVTVRSPSSGTRTGNITVRANGSAGGCASPSSSIYRTMVLGKRYPNILGPSQIGRFAATSWTVGGTGITNVSWTVPNGWTIESVSSTHVFARNNGNSGWVDLSYQTCGETVYRGIYVTVSGSGGPFMLRGQEEALDNDFERDLTLYPNPAQDQVTLKSNSPIASVQIVDPTGREIKTWTVEDTEVSLDIADLKPGTYFVRSQDINGSPSVRSLIVE
ncbi:MAG TPA: hypothetical protein DCR93_32590 [Cytophagales bacterium]|nr:hypothetical protein [Cytophagales bacterium]HAP64027.1 hypothetical protein [Cytophagales bacterium]